MAGAASLPVGALAMGTRPWAKLQQAVEDTEASKAAADAYVDTTRPLSGVHRVWAWDGRARQG